MNKEQFRKELEDAIMIGRTDPRRSERNAYINSRLAALDDGDDGNIQKALDELKRFYDYGNEVGYSNSELSRISSCIDKVRQFLPKPLDDGQEGKGLAIEFYKWAENLSPSEMCTVHAPAGSGAGTGIYVLTTEELYDKYLDYKNRASQPTLTPALPVADGEGEKVGARYFLCSRDIKVGDRVYNTYVNEWHTVQEGWNLEAFSESSQDFKIIGEIPALALLPSVVTGGVKGAIEYFKRLAKNEYGASYNVNTIIHVLEEYENK